MAHDPQAFDQDTAPAEDNAAWCENNGIDAYISTRTKKPEPQQSCHPSAPPARAAPVSGRLLRSLCHRNRTASIGRKCHAVRSPWGFVLFSGAVK